MLDAMVGGARVVSGAAKRKINNHLIEAAPFGRLDQMLRMAVYPPGFEPLWRFEPLGGFKQKQLEASKSKQWQAIESARI